VQKSTEKSEDQDKAQEIVVARLFYFEWNCLEVISTLCHYYWRISCFL